MEIRFLELPKLRKKLPDMSKPLERWMVFIEDSPEKVLEMGMNAEPTIAKAEGRLETSIRIANSLLGILDEQTIADKAGLPTDEIKKSI